MANNIGNVSVWLFGALLCCALSVPAGILSDSVVFDKRPQIAEAVASSAIDITADVSIVKSGGMWADGNTEGHYRIIISNRGFDHVVSKLYLQWIEMESEKGTYRTRATVGFAALNDIPVYNLEVIRWIPDKNRLRVQLDAYNSYSGEKSRFILDATTPGIATLINQ